MCIGAKPRKRLYTTSCCNQQNQSLTIYLTLSRLSYPTLLLSSMSTPPTGCLRRRFGSSPAREINAEQEPPSILPLMDIKSSPRRQQTYSSDHNFISSPRDPITDLPPDLQITILAAQSSVQNALHLSSTCLTLRKTFFSNVDQILSSIMSNGIPSPDELKTLAGEMFSLGLVPGAQPQSQPTHLHSSESI